MDAMEFAIADQASEVKECFTKLKRDISSKKHQDALFKFPEGFDPEDYLDLYARFLLWAENIGTLQRNKSSLDFRLRHSDLRMEIIRLLKQIQSAIIDLVPIVEGRREQETWFASPWQLLDTVVGDETLDKDFESDSDPGSEAAEEDPKLSTECGELLQVIAEGVKSLLKLSLLIQKSSRGAKFTKLPKGEGFDARSDTLHIQQVFPRICANMKLCEKLGKANSQRRQWLSYRKRHREKLSAPSQQEARNISGELASDIDPSFEKANPALSSLLVSSIGSHFSETTVESTTATSHYDSARVSPQATLESTDSYAETVFSGSSGSAAEGNSISIPDPPPGYTERPVECPYCFRIIFLEGFTSWVKHIHSDLASYVCTSENCSHLPFESRGEWIQHEMETHRRQWACLFCPTVLSAVQQFKTHLLEFHYEATQRDQFDSLSRLSEQPLQEIIASACPFCDYPQILRLRGSISNQKFVKISHFQRHVAHHLEQIALFVLPKLQWFEEAEHGDRVEECSDAESARSIESDKGMLDATQISTMDSAELLSVLAFDTNECFDSPPNLALGWQPPHDFTPPAADFETNDPDLIPHREESTFGGDLFTPGWVRGLGKNVEGFCARCDVGHWVNIFDTTYEYHLTYLHGIPRTGIPLKRPSVIRNIPGNHGRWEGFCDECRNWRTLKKTVRGWNWFWHCLTEHTSTSSASKSLETTESRLSSINIVSKTHDAVGQTQSAEVNAYMAKLRAGVSPADTDVRGKNMLHHAAELGDPDLISIIVETSKKTSELSIRDLMNAKTNAGVTALMLATGHGNGQAVEILSQEHADINILREDGETALDIAAKLGHAKVLEILLKYGADIEDSKAFSRLYLQARRENKREDLPQVENADSKAKAKRDDWNDLMRAAFENDIEEIQRLLDNADIEATASDGQTALMIAGSRRNTEAINYLISMGANIDVVNEKGWTTLMNAVKTNDLVTVNVLLTHGADVNHLSPDHWTALAEGAQRGLHEILLSLLKCGADTESRSSHDWTPLMHASFQGDLKSVSILLDAGADPDSASQRDASPLLLAAAAGHLKICQKLFDSGALTESAWARKNEAEAEAKTPTKLGPLERAYSLGWTPLMVACQGGHEDVVRFLLRHGARVDTMSPMGKIAFAIAEENGWMNIVDILEHYGQ